MARFDEDTYARARAWQEKQKDKPSAAPAPSRPSKVRVAPPKAKAAPAPSPAPAPAPAAKGSGRGSSAGPTAAELDSYAKKQRDEKFADSIKANLSTSERGDMDKYKNRAMGAATAATALMPALRMAKTAASTKGGKEALSALKEMTAGGPRVASRVTPKPKPAMSSSTAARGKTWTKPAEATKDTAKKRSSAKGSKETQARGADWSSRDSANKAVKRSRATPKMKCGGKVKRGY